MPLGLYIHYPFCKSKCLYCDFNSVPYRDSLARQYLKALTEEILFYKSRNLQLGSIYLGGGTPSLMSADELGAIITAIHQAFRVLNDAEITLEANPGDVTGKKAGAWRELGVNRVSVGAQSFSDFELCRLGRRHECQEIRNSWDILRNQGFCNLSLDLIFGIPGQSLSSWEQSLVQAVQLAPEHLSVYGLTYEQGTPLYNLRAQGHVEPVSADDEASMYELAAELLRAEGYKRYEVSNFATSSFESRHNLIYWHNEEYIGVGAGAYSYLKGVRSSNYTEVDDYVATVSSGQLLPTDEKEIIPQEMQAIETLIQGMRLEEGLCREDFLRKFSFQPEDLVPCSVFRELESDGLIMRDEARIYPTERGMILGNEVALRLLPGGSVCEPNPLAPFPAREGGKAPPLSVSERGRG